MMKTQVKSVMLLVANAYIGWQARLSFQALCLRYLNLVPRDSLVRNVGRAIA